jgi:peptide/nickel transport system substrate-binding protein
MKKIFYFLTFVITIASLVLGGCSKEESPTSKPPVTSSAQASAPSSSAAAAKPQSGGDIKIIVRVTIGTLGSPNEGTAVYYPMSAAPAMQNLLLNDKDGNPITSQSTLAESFDISADGITVTLHLRKGVKFQDGTAFNAEAVKYNLENFAPGKVVPDYLKNVASYTIVDENTLRVVLKKFDPSFLSSLGKGNAGIIASPAALKIASTPEKAAKDHMVGTGAFKFVSWQRDVSVKYEKWNQYWEPGKPYLNSIEIDQVVDPVTSLVSFQKGDAQVLVGITPKEARSLESQGFQIFPSVSLIPISCLTPDGANPDSPFADKRVRQAVEYALDKKAIAQSMGQGYYQGVTQYAAPTDARYVQGLEPRNFDPAKAKQLLADAGYSNGFKTKLIAQDTWDRDFLQAIQNYLKQVGIDADLDVADVARYRSYYTNGWKNGLMVHPSAAMPLSGMYMYFGPIGNNSLTYLSAWRPPGWLDKVQAAMNQVDSTKRLVQERELVKIIYEESMGIPIATSAFLEAQDKKVHELDWGVGSNYIFKPQNGWLSK